MTAWLAVRLTCAINSQIALPTMLLHIPIAESDDTSDTFSETSTAEDNEMFAVATSIIIDKTL